MLGRSGFLSRVLSVKGCPALEPLHRHRQSSRAAELESIRRSSHMRRTPVTRRLRAFLFPLISYVNWVWVFLPFGKRLMASALLLDAWQATHV